MSPPSTVPDVLLRVAAAASPRAALGRERDGGWRPISAMQLYHRVRRLALALEHLGVGRGDRVVLLAENRWE
jgi:long-chain acyl-CoA synthetase